METSIDQLKDVLKTCQEFKIIPQVKITVLMMCTENMNPLATAFAPSIIPNKRGLAIPGEVEDKSLEKWFDGATGLKVDVDEDEEEDEYGDIDTTEGRK